MLLVVAYSRGIRAGSRVLFVAKKDDSKQILTGWRLQLVGRKVLQNGCLCGNGYPWVTELVESDLVQSAFAWDSGELE
jgi:hypothetical protein